MWESWKIDAGRRAVLQSRHKPATRKMQTEYKEFSAVNAAAYNPRIDLKPGDPEWEDIKSSWERFGQVQGLVWNKRTGNVVGGHQRINVSKALGKTGAFFVIVDLSLEDEQQLNLILNKVAGRWEKRKLADVLGNLQKAGADLSKLGFRTKELADAMTLPIRKPKADVNKAFPYPEEDKARTQAGDVFRLVSTQGTAHRLMCGDARDVGHMEALSAGLKYRMVFTDPGPKPKADSLKGDTLRDFLLAGFTAMASLLTAKAAIYTFHDPFARIETEQALSQAGFKLLQPLVWAKNAASLGKAHYHRSHEPLLYACRLTDEPEWFGAQTERTLMEMPLQELKRLSKEEAVNLLQGLRDTADVFRIDRDPVTSFLHPTQKPVECARRAIGNSSMPGDTVLDSFAGTGSTLIAAEMSGRFSHHMEAHRGLCDAMIRRWLVTFDGATAERNGEPFTLADI